MYAIYMRCNNGRYYPIDLHEGRVVNRLLYASLWQTREQAERVLAKLQEFNKTFTFQVRKVGK